MFKYLSLSIVFLINLTILRAQEDTIIKIDSKTSKSDIYIDVEQKPEFPGGKEGIIGFYKKISSFSICDNKEDYCQILYYQVVIDTAGNVENFKIIKGINKVVDEETEKIIKQMPKWSPGKKNGKLVKVLMTLDIKYKF